MSSASGSPTMACEVCPMSCVSSCWPLLTQPWLWFVTCRFVLLPTAVLVLYFKYFLQWDDNLSTAIYHTFVALCYLTPILGALIADSWLGKFKWVLPQKPTKKLWKLLWDQCYLNHLLKQQLRRTASELVLATAGLFVFFTKLEVLIDLAQTEPALQVNKCYSSANQLRTVSCFPSKLDGFFSHLDKM